ncbi:Uma2 family endonuclease [Myxococcus stipitatus]|uniref:Uma2 family endonuclease n=1 Tax=Myxococcus stipitatus TaxID=83455 RepID=UPI001F48036E|nr:Uma2 family endonuclease [Myxococcus stipitatus]MCE9670922.1 Uma2 family endonuclease [Myxococcus stipitatus]
MSDEPRPEDLYEALERLPEHVVGELIDGELLVSPRPRTAHSRAAILLIHALGPFDDESGHQGPGGWIFLSEPELHLGRDVLVPDLAAWRRERMPELPDVVGVTLPPDWVCEVLSPSTESLDRGKKMERYARAGVRYLWLLDPRKQRLEVFRLASGAWALCATHADSPTVRAEPFEAENMNLHSLWAR